MGSRVTDRCLHDAIMIEQRTIAMKTNQATNESKKCSYTEHDQNCHGLQKLTCHAGHEQHQRDAPHDVHERLKASAATDSVDRWLLCKGLAAELASDGLCAQDST
jgi:hypothetical protein